MQHGFLLSATLHGLVVALLLLWSYAASQNSKPAERILELVAGEGNNYGATVAPALGTPGGVKLNLPKPVIPKAEPIAPTPEPVAVEPAPPKPESVKPAPPPPTKQAAKAPRSIATTIRNNLWRAEAKGKAAAEKERLAEQARLAKEAANAKSQLKHIDAEGIAKGVIGGSTANKEGGAGGKELTSNGGGDMERYLSMLRARLLESLDKPHGVSDTLEAEAEFWLAANGTISRVRISKRSGSREFDDAVLAAFGRVDMPKRPDGKSEMAHVTFRTRDAAER